jgi:3' exoribonuclease, RNase T-like
MAHIMMDFETLSTDIDTVILTMGLVKFDPRGNGIIDKLELRPDVDSQIEKYKRTISEDTLKWWGQQSPEAIEEAMGFQNRISLRECMDRLYKFCWNSTSVWSNGSVFDIMIAESAFKQLDMTPPWQFWQIRDCRTLYEMAGVSLKDKKYGTKTTHKAVEDAEHQAIVAQDAYRKLMKAGLIV